MEALYQPLALAQVGPVGGIALERLAYVTQQNLGGDRFLKKSKRALKESLHSGRDLRVSTDEYDRNDCTAKVELLLQLQTAHSRHLHVQQQAAGLACVIEVKKGLRRLHHAGLNLLASQHGAEVTARDVVVIHYVDGGCSLAHALPRIQLCDTCGMYGCAQVALPLSGAPAPELCRR